MNVDNNLRFKSTEDKIRNALATLLKNKNFQDIYVKDVCKEAGINRSTFYEHYQDINDLMIKTEESLVKQINFIFPYNKRCSLDDLISYFEFVKSNSDFYKAYFLNHYESNMSKQVFVDYINNSDIEIDRLNWILHKSFFGAGLMAITKIWILSGMKQTIEYIANLVYEEYIQN